MNKGIEKGERENEKDSHSMFKNLRGRDKETARKEKRKLERHKKEEKRVLGRRERERRMRQ